MTAGELRKALAKVDDDCRVQVSVYGEFWRDGKTCLVTVIDDEIKSVSIGYVANAASSPIPFTVTGG